MVTAGPKERETAGDRTTTKSAGTHACNKRASFGPGFYLLQGGVSWVGGRGGRMEEGGMNDE